MTYRGTVRIALAFTLTAACGRTVIGTASTTVDDADMPADLITADDCITWSNGVAFPLDCDPATANTTGDGTVLACGRLEPTEVTVQGGNVYWAESTGIIATVPAAGGRGHILQCSDGYAYHLTSDSRGLYWSQHSSFTTAYGTTGLFSLALNGGKRTQIASPPEPVTLLLHAEQLLWADYTTAAIDSLDLGSLAISQLAGNQPDMLSLAVTSSAAYWVESGTGLVMKLDFQPGALPVVLATGQTEPVSITVNAHGVFWENGGSMSSDCQIMRMDDEPGALPQIVADNESSPASLVADDDAIYWTTDSYGGNHSATIRKLSMTSGALPTTLAAEQLDPGQPVISGAYLYWTNSGFGGSALEGSVRRIVK